MIGTQLGHKDLFLGLELKAQNDETDNQKQETQEEGNDYDPTEGAFLCGTIHAVVLVEPSQSQKAPQSNQKQYLGANGGPGYHSALIRPQTDQVEQKEEEE